MDNMDYNSQPTTKFHPKILYVILGIVFVGEIIWGIYTWYTFPTVISQSIPKQHEQTDGSAALMTSKNDYNVGDTIKVSIKLDTGGHKISASDVIVHFDPNVLEATSSAVNKGWIYDSYPKLEVDSEKGLITISGVSLETKSIFSGIGVLADIKFEAKAPGNTKVSLDFQPGSTLDSNIVDQNSGKDILGSVRDLEFTIK